MVNLTEPLKASLEASTWRKGEVGSDVGRLEEAA